MQSVMEQPESGHQRKRPQSKQQQQRERSVIAEQGIVLLFVAAKGGKPRPGPPGGAIEKSSKPELASDPAREHYGLKGLPQDHHDEHKTENDGENFHEPESPQALEYLKCRKNSAFCNQGKL